MAQQVSFMDAPLRRALALLGPPKQRALLDEIALWLGGAAMIAAALIWWHFISQRQGPELWWDFRVYKAASDAIAAGQNPYDDAVIHARSGTGMTFVVPPLPAEAIRAWSRSPLRFLFEPVMKTACVAAYLYTLIALVKVFVGSLRPSLLFFAFGASLMAFNVAGFNALVMGNMGTILHGLIVLGMVQGLTKKKWAFFHAVVLAASVFKPFYPLYWIVPALAQGWNWRQIGIAVCGVIASALLYYVGAKLDPVDQAAWLRNLLHISLGPERHNGAGVFSAASLIFPDPWPYVLQFAFMGLVIAILAFRPIRDEKMRWAALVFAAVMLNPRLNLSDLPVAVVPMLYLYARLLPEAFNFTERFGLAAFLTIVFGMAHDIASPVWSWDFMVLLIVPILLASAAPRIVTSAPPAFA